MAEYFETDDVAKGYDPDIFRRMLSYLKPYRAAVALAGLALLLSTLGELAMPLLIRTAMDDAILPGKRLLRLGAADMEAPALKALASAKASRGFSDGEVRFVFVPRTALKAFSGAEQKDLTARGVLDKDDWYLVEGASSPAKAAAIAAHPNLFLRPSAGGQGGGDAAALRSADLAVLREAERGALRADDLRGLTLVSLVFLGALAVVLAATFVQTWVSNDVGQRVMKDMRLELYGKTAGQSLAFLSRHPSGRLVTRLTGDVETINQFFTDALAAFLKDLAVMVGVLIALFALSPLLGLISAATLPPVFILAAFMRVRAREAFREQRTSVSRLNSYLAERLAGMQVVQLFGQESRSSGDFSALGARLLKANLGEMHVFATFRPAVDLLSSVTTAAVLLSGAALYLNQSISLGVLVAFVGLIGMFYSPLKDIAEKYTTLQSAMAGGERVFALLDADERIPDRSTRSFPERLEGRVDFENVRFAYKKGEDVLRGLSFSAEPGSMIAIVGYTGAGKTTIANLITRLWDVDGGRILLDGIPVRDLELSRLRRAVLPVLQDVFLFSGSVADNISLGSPMGEAELRRAAEAVHAHGFIEALPDGYATVLSEGATNISSGQRQLISFARVVAHDPRVVILDEATSSVDTETEGLIRAGLDTVLAGRTSIVIAHRLSTIRHADRILVLSGGVVAESGTNDELLAKDGLYANLYRLQYERDGA